MGTTFYSCTAPYSARKAAKPLRLPPSANLFLVSSRAAKSAFLQHLSKTTLAQSVTPDGLRQARPASGPNFVVPRQEREGPQSAQSERILKAVPGRAN
jgi:hypothetical protein